MRKTELQKTLATIAPSICIRTIWQVDEDCGPISRECDGFDPSEDYNWTPWQSNVKAVAIVSGEEIEGNAYLGGTWEKAGDVPEESNPEISGYENQMTVEALEELMEAFRPFYEKHEGENLEKQINEAVAHCKSIT